MNDSPDSAPHAAFAGTVDTQRKREEFRAWVFLCFVMTPLLSVLIVGGYGFLVWMYQLLAGPPGS
jgi:nitrate reductase NapE